MTATPGAGLDHDSRPILRRYYLAMSVPFGIDLLTSVVYAVVNEHPLSLLPLAATSAIFLLVGVGVGARLLIRPINRFLAGEVTFEAIEHRLTRLPRHSAAVVTGLCAPMLGLRLLAPHLHYTFGASIEVSAWTDTVCTFLVVTSFNFVLTFFVVNAYLDGLCAHLFRERGVNISSFSGVFRHKVALALLFVAFAAMTLLGGDIASYDGDRLLREASVDLMASITGAGAIYYWISRALTLPIDRLDHGMGRVARGDLEVRLPVTSNDEIGRAISGFNQMVEGLAERGFLRDVFGKYVNRTIATAILQDQKHSGRAADTLAEATLMFIDIEGFTSLSERLQPKDVARILNTYLGIVVPAIHRRGGVVNSFIGDGLFASFNLPLTLENHAAAAVRTAIDIQTLLAGVTFASDARVQVRIGLNTGPVIGVTIGAEDRLQYTLLGDAVNIASRVEQLNKQFGSLILATESTMSAAGNGFPSKRLGETGVRGHRGEVVVYRIDPA